MTAVETVMERVRHLDEKAATQLLPILDDLEQERSKPTYRVVKSSMEMLGFARKYHSEQKTTAEWMAEIRGGDDD
jgi:hypothetical protein